MKRLPFSLIRDYLHSLDHFILLESTAPSDDNHYSYLFTKPLHFLETDGRNTDQVQQLFKSLHTYTETFYAAGYIPYEMGYSFYTKFAEHTSAIKARFGIYANPYCYNHKEGKFESIAPPTRKPDNKIYSISDITIAASHDSYTKAINKIKQYIADGDTYQVNFTTRLRFSFSGSPIALYESLRSAQPTAYCALMRFGNTWILSLSPELFFRIDGNTITARPMKGTMHRGKTNEEDSVLIDTLKNDTKNRAENLMIVDLLRNDIGRIAETGSVTVPDLFTVERYRSVLQMTSSIKGKLNNNTNLFDIITSLFPCGSVTGAPKLRTMEIIRELEVSPRGIYTGAIGMIKPGRDMIFNVPIRTIEIEGDRGLMGIGSGIVWDSDPEEEYQECLLKAQFLTNEHKPVELIESMRYENGLHRLDMHLDRLEDSARYFDIPVNREQIIKILNGTKSKLDETGVYKIRLILDEERNIDITYERITPEIEQPVRLKLCSTPTDSNDRFLYHKTNRRELYQSEYRKAQEEGYFDVLFHNERDEITEGAITNVYIKQNDILYTPPVACGLLNGVYRKMLLSEGKAEEKTITVDVLLNGGEIFVSNSVRELMRGYVEQKS